MTPLYLYNGALLTENGALAISQDCCCDICCLCPDGFPLRVSPDTYSAITIYPCNSDTGYWSEFATCSGVGYTVNLPEVPSTINTPCGDDGQGGTLDFYWPEYTISYYFYAVPLSEWFVTYGSASEIYVAAGGTVFYIDTEKLTNDYDNCNIFAFTHDVYINKQEYQCINDFIYFMKGTNTQQSCLQIVQIIPEECDLIEPRALSATINDITSEVVLSGTIGISGVSASVTDNCVDVFTNNTVTTYDPETGFSTQYSDTEALEGSLEPEYIDPVIMLEPIAFCSGCPDE